MTKPKKPSKTLNRTLSNENREYSQSYERYVQLDAIREVGEFETCSQCEGRIEVFKEDCLKARFIIILEADGNFSGGGRCAECKLYICLRCAAKTVYGKGRKRIHCPVCGSLLTGLRRNIENGAPEMGAILREPEFEASYRIESLKIRI